MLEPIAGGALSFATFSVSPLPASGWRPTARAPSLDEAVSCELSEEMAVADLRTVKAIEGLSSTTWYWYVAPGSTALSSKELEVIVPSEVKLGLLPYERRTWKSAPAAPVQVR
jgi:hypothetical protein